MASEIEICRSSYDEMNKLNVTKQLEIMQNLYNLWEEVGIDEEARSDRAIQVWNYVFELLFEIKHEEASYVEEIKERIKNFKQKISVLNTELQLPEVEKFTGTLIEQEQAFRELYDKLFKMKHRLQREFDELLSQRLELCKILGMPSQSFKISSASGFPIKEDIFGLQQEIKSLQEEKLKRQLYFLELKKEFNDIIEQTELSTEIPFEKEIFNQQEDTCSLSTVKLKQLEQIVAETKKRKVDLENERTSLMEKLFSLWNSLEINLKERELFLSQHTDCRISNMNALKKEIARCEQIRKENLSSLKEELMSLWNKCFVLPSENMLPQIQEDEISKADLENYNNELKKWRKYFKDIEHIIQKIAKRQELWDQMMVFENKAMDPNRFRNRGGNLLMEEKQRKQLQKALPELEEKIIIDIKNYEKETGKKFLYYGEQFEIFMKKQWENKVNQKENEKLIKKRNKLEEFRTPSKQSFSTMTPKSGKGLRSVEPFIYKTPNFSLTKQSLRTPSSCFKNENKATNKMKKSILKEKNRSEVLSERLDSTTYAEFASKLNKSSKIHHQSSFLSSNLNARARSSLNKRKNDGKNIRKSLRKK